MAVQGETQLLANPKMGGSMEKAQNGGYLPEQFEIGHGFSGIFCSPFSH